VSIDYFGELIKKYKSKGILIDSNLLLLLFIGLYDQDLIARFKRTKKYVKEDFTTLTNILDCIDKIITTPHVLTEVSNLSGQLHGNVKFNYFKKIEQLLDLELVDEKHKTARDISKNQCFHKFGITDTGIIEIAKGKYLVITDDATLAYWLQSNKIDVINFENIRPLKWEFPHDH